MQGGGVFVFNAKCWKWICLIKDLSVFWFWIISSLMNSSMFFFWFWKFSLSFRFTFFVSKSLFILTVLLWKGDTNCCCCFEGWCKLGTVLSVSLPFIGEVVYKTASVEGQWYRLKEQYSFLNSFLFRLLSSVFVFKVSRVKSSLI